MTEKKDLSNLLDKEIEKAEEMRQYYRELLARYEGKIEALKDIRYDLNQEEEEEKKGEGRIASALKLLLRLLLFSIFPWKEAKMKEEKKSTEKEKSSTMET